MTERFWTTRLFGEEPSNILNIVETLPGMDAILVYQSGRIAYTKWASWFICNFNFRKEFPWQNLLRSLEQTPNVQQTANYFNTCKIILLTKAETELVEIKDIPVFNKPANKQVPEAILEIAAKIEEADGVIIGIPEYDHSIPQLYWWVHLLGYLMGSTHY